MEEDDLFASMLPIVQSVFATTLSVDFVQVAPLGPPSNMIHFMDYMYGDSEDRGVLGEIYKKYKRANPGENALTFEDFVDELSKGNEEFIKTIII